MDHVAWHTEPSGRSSILILALEGLFDIADSATAAVDHLIERAESKTRVASIDPENFFDFTQQRPIASFDENKNRTLAWPENDAWRLEIAGYQNEIVAIAGIEPHLRWRTFANAVGEIASRSGARLVVTLGAMAGLAPHTRTLGVVGSASDLDLAHRLGLGSPSYQGPTGLIGALHVRLHELGLAVISLRVSVPHYVAEPPNPEATRSLLSRLELVTGIPSGHHDLDEAARAWRERVDHAVASDHEISHYVTQLEHQIDNATDLLPDGDSIAAELAAWLRDSHGGDPGISSNDEPDDHPGESPSS